MSRMLRKEWKNKRSGYSRRARWYDNDQRSFRIDLEDEFYQVNRFFTEREEAQKLYDAFVKAAGSDIPFVIDGRNISVVQLACKVTGVRVPGFDEHKTLSETLADYERTPEFAKANKWFETATPGARMPEALE